MGTQTPLYRQHMEAGAKMVDFGGWDLPIHYGSQLEEHHAVRNSAGMFDVSHMTIVDITGAGTHAFLQHLLANDVNKLTTPGRALYSCMLNDNAGVIDDLIVYKLEDSHYRMIVNASTREKDLAWLRLQSQPYEVAIHEETGTAMVAVQGPKARELCHQQMPNAVAEAAAAQPRFSAVHVEGWFVARTGYTGEDGYEVVPPLSSADEFWSNLASSGVVPTGLGARDTLRLEAGMALYGNDLDESHTPFDSGLAWTVALRPDERQFIGRTALEAQRERGDAKKMVGLMLEGRGVLRSHQKVFIGDLEVGEITSGTFSPTPSATIALARVEPDMPGQCDVEIRNKRIPAREVPYPFVKNSLT
ncbi:MAG: glycine cleavage system aminomethyltransferase GcvT [Pseudomonadota bacterium]